LLRLRFWLWRCLRLLSRNRRIKATPRTIANESTVSNVRLDVSTNADIYDVLGRTIRAGIRFNC
jgi:hypothetical protein